MAETQDPSDTNIRSYKVSHSDNTETKTPDTVTKDYEHVCACVFTYFVVETDNVMVFGIVYGCKMFTKDQRESRRDCIMKERSFSFYTKV